MDKLCVLSGATKQAYYKRDKELAMRQRALESFALEFIHGVRENASRLGGRKLWIKYKDKMKGNQILGRDRFMNLIDRYGLKIRRKVRKPKTTDSTHGLPVFPNLVYAFIPQRINELWVSDITYIPVWVSDREYTFCYLSLITDAYSHEIIGWEVGASLEARYTSQALEMALKRLEGLDKKSVEKPIHHSDRGVQYASVEYVDILKENSIRISMTENGNPKDNAIAERINRTIKDEFLKDIRFRSIREVRDAIAKAVEFYNNERPHMSIDMMTPAQAAKCNGELKKWWKSYRDKAIKNGRA